jgi:hypothetical protein
MNPAEGIGSAGLGRGTELRGTKQRLLWLKYVGRFGRGVRGQEIPARSLSLEAMQIILGFFFFFFFSSLSVRASETLQGFEHDITGIGF